MTEIRIEAADSVPWADVEAALSHGGNGSTCWCQWVVNPEYPVLTREEKHDALQVQLGRAHLTAPLVAYVDDLPAGWCRVAARVDQPRLAHTNVVTRGSTEPLDDGSVWAVTCFVVRREYRGTGVSRALLHSAVELARGSGARLVEGYPIDRVERPGASPNSRYLGTVDLFESAGFVVTSRPAPGRAVVTLQLGG
jgi:GNAT superfamily N-acetyltransferase